MKYAVFGNLMLDNIYFSDGSCSCNQLGGPAPFALSGIKLWTDDCVLGCNVGVDFDATYGPWMRQNRLSTEAIKAKTDRCTYTRLGYFDNGTYGQTDFCPSFTPEELMAFIQGRDYMAVTPEDIAAVVSGGDVKGIYIVRDCDLTFWRQLKAIKERDSFSVMWEIENDRAIPENLDRVREILQAVDVFSCNVQEACNLFSVGTEEDALDQLKKLDVDMIVFRVGAKGLYTIAKGQSWFHASLPNNGVVDATGCGNSSTGSALWGYCETHNPVAVGIIANIASSLNLRYRGVIPDILSLRETAYVMKDQLLAEYAAKQGG